MSKHTVGGAHPDRILNSHYENNADQPISQAVGRSLMAQIDSER
jgi:hypothetical protein